jgi:hypothetical protein
MVCKLVSEFEPSAASINLSCVYVQARFRSRIGGIVGWLYKTRLNRLNEPANAQINWTFGNLLRARATRADWLNCPLLQQLETEANQNLNAWNELCRRTRESLANETDLQRKAESLLAPDSQEFDVNLDDFLAEMLGAVYLGEIFGLRTSRFPRKTILRPGCSSAYS